MARCGFKTNIEYYDEKTGKYVPYVCPEPEENVLESDLCIFHDENYLRDSIKKEANEKSLKSKFVEKLAKSEPLICIGYHIPDISFKQAHFDKSVNFSRAVFMSVNFSEAHFTERADFSGAQFTKEVNFYNAKFTEEVNFINANFIDADFAGRVSFTNTKFNGRVSFANTKFNGAYFYRAQFTEVDFSIAQFTERADFSGAQFTKEVNFTETIFSERADFSGAQFTKEVNFNGTIFTERASFASSQFTERADFSGAYVKKAIFSYAKFKKAVFYKTRFAEEADFSEIKSTEEKANPILDFHNVQFDIPEHIAFLKDNLSDVSFVNTDTTRVRFGEDVVWGDKDKFKIREEREIENQLKTKNFATDYTYSPQMGDVLAVYRNLRENYEFRMRYSEAGQFFIREMEMNRLYREDTKNGQTQIRLNNWVTRNLSLTGLYYHLSKYGQSFSRPALFGIGIVLVSTLLWLTQPNPAAPDYSIINATLPVMNNSRHITVAFERSLTNFLPSLSFGTALGVGLLDVAFKIIRGAVTFGLIIIALRRKFERKFRH